MKNYTWGKLVFENALAKKDVLVTNVDVNRETYHVQLSVHVKVIAIGTFNTTSKT